jgi:hypothetical protein
MGVAEMAKSALYAITGRPVLSSIPCWYWRPGPSARDVG